MTMGYLRTKVVDQAKSWIGYNESDKSHRKIIDIYNAHKPLARGYKVTYTDAWCATFVSAVAIKLGYTKIIPTECSCNKMIDLFKKAGAWVENDAYVPSPGDILFYDWDDKNTGENVAEVEHVGIVEKVVNNVMTIIEGNYDNSVGRRSVKLNGKYIRGFGVPKYDDKPVATTSKNTSAETAISVKLSQIKRGSKGKAVEVWQTIVGADADGDFGPATEAATIAFQKKAFPSKKSEWDGIVGNKTWKAGLESL